MTLLNPLDHEEEEPSFLFHNQGPPIEEIHKLHQMHINTKYRIFSILKWIIKEVVTDNIFFILSVLRSSVTHNHVVDTLK